jgi:hypothetical protein
MTRRCSLQVVASHLHHHTQPVQILDPSELPWGLLESSPPYPSTVA